MVNKGTSYRHGSTKKREGVAAKITDKLSLKLGNIYIPIKKTE